ncbi:ATP-binding protein [Rhodoblastus sp.]|uniref:ATP-binding protein n=1 Tax=Rhodoblastus sp. TaxID=1962975 RepID=UPI003F9A7C29
MTINRLLLAMLVLAGARLQAVSGSKGAQEFIRYGMPWLQAFLIMTTAIQAHIVLRPAPDGARRFLGILVDSAAISFGMRYGGTASGYLFPLYFWMILGNGLRFGRGFMVAALIGAAAGFAATVWFTPFWRANVGFSAGLFLALFIIPIYGVLLLSRLAEARAEAERANHAKTLLLACVSHELRTPLTAIVGLSALLQGTKLDVEQLGMVRTVSDAGAILLRHIEELLTVSRDEIERRPDALERVDLFALLIGLRALLAVEADRKGLRLGLCIEAGTPRHIVAEPALLLDVLQNLVGNAIKFTQAGAVAIHVGVARRDLKSLDLRVKISDSGIGIEKTAQERIFDSFVQADLSISRRFGGSGLGLALARRRLETQGGHMGVESELGEGSCFWFELSARIEGETALSSRSANSLSAAPRRAEWAGPFDGPQDREPVCLSAAPSFDALALARRFAYAALASDDDPDSWARARDLAALLKELAAGEADASPEKCLPSMAAKNQRPMRILLAEDNGVNRMVLDKILTCAGHATTLAADGESALSAMLEGDFDVIVLDLNMPGISGLEAAQLYQFALPTEARAPILALTADADGKRRQQCRQAGMVAVLTKPLTPETLLDAVAAAAAKGRGGLPKCKAPEPETEGMALDPAALKVLAALGGAAFLRDLILQFTGEGTRTVERMANAVVSGDIQAFQHEAHALDSSAGNIGATNLARLCRRWRSAGGERIVVEGDVFLAELRGEWSRVGAALNEVLAQAAVRRRAEISVANFSRRDISAA